MKKRVLSAFIIFTFLFVLFNSCSQQISEAGKTSGISLCLPYANYERLAEYNENSLFYKVSCKDSTGKYNVEKTAFSGEKVFFQDLYPGRYKISVNAYYSDKLLVELYAGEKYENLLSGEQKSVEITLERTFTRTEVPVPLWSLQERNSCARIDLSGQKLSVEISKNCPVKPVYYYWYCEGAIFEELSGPDCNVLEKLPENLERPDAFGVIVKFEDDSYAVRSYMLDALIESEYVKKSVYTKNESEKAKFTYSFTYPNLSTEVRTSIVPVNSIISGTDYSSVEGMINENESEFKSTSGITINTKTSSEELELEEGWYLINTELCMFNDGYGSSSNPLIYYFQNAVYVDKDYNLNCEIVFPFEEFYNNYNYKIEWNLDGGTWPEYYEPPVYILDDCPQKDGLFVISVPAPVKENLEFKEFVASKDYFVEYDEKNRRYKIYFDKNTINNENLTITAKYKVEIEAKSVDDLIQALNNPGISVIYLTGNSYTINSSINIDRSLYILPENNICSFMPSEDLQEPMFKINGEESINVIIGDDNKILMITGFEEEDGKETCPIFEISGSLADVTFNSLEVASNYGSAVRCGGGVLTVVNSIIMSCKSNNGGSIYCENTNLNVNSCIFDSNEASDRGGAIYCKDSVVSIDNSCMFSNNIAGVYGGAIHSEASNITIKDSSFETNMASDGGAICAAIQNGEVFVLSGVVFGTDEKENLSEDQSPNCKLFTGDSFDPIFIDSEILNLFGIYEISEDLGF